MLRLDKYKNVPKYGKAASPTPTYTTKINQGRTAGIIARNHSFEFVPQAKSKPRTARGAARL
jgi:hypothetical protein